MHEGSDNITSNIPDTPTTAKRNPWKRALKVGGVILGGIMLLIIVAFTVTLWILTPQRLTPIVERIASDNLRADVNIGRVELTFWKSFPRLKVEVNDLDIVSRSLDKLPPEIRENLQSDADSLLSIGYFTGGVNVLRAITGRIYLSNVIIDRPRLNLLQVTDSVSNFDIFPVSPPDTAKTSIPEIYLNHFAVTNAHPIIFRSIPDSVTVNLQLNNIQLNDDGLPKYELTIDSDIATPLLDYYRARKISFNLDGGINWNARKPYKVGLENLVVGLEFLRAKFNSEVDFTDQLCINSFDVKFDPIEVNKLLSFVPEEYIPLISPLETDMTILVDGHLDRPLVLDSNPPAAFGELNIEIPSCKVKYKQLDFNTLKLLATARLRGSDINRAVIDLKKLEIDGKTVDLALRMTADNLTGDPCLKGHVAGSVDFSSLPAVILDKLDAHLEGTIGADTEFRFRLGDFTPKRFHRIFFNGKVNLDNFRFVSSDSVTGAYARHSLLTFNSNDCVVQDDFTADSILHLRLKADTASFFTEGIKGDVSDLAATIGTANRASSSDTTKINPLGASLRIGKINYHSLLDTINVRMTNATGVATLSRFAGEDKNPRLGLKLNIERAHASQGNGGGIRGGLRDATIQMVAHLRGLDKRSADSIGRRNRRNDDAISGNVRRRGKRGPTAAQLDSMGATMINFGANNSIKDLLMRWKVAGSVAASRGSFRLPDLALNNRFRNLQMNFSTDSVILNNLDYKIGQSDFKFDGKVTNIRKAVGSIRPQPLRIDVNVLSDTININEVVRALSGTPAHKVSDAESEISEWAHEEQTDIEHPEEIPDSIVGPILVPLNIDAGFTINAANVVFSDLLMHDFKGQLLLYDGVANLNNLSATTEVGSLNLSALYSAPLPDKIHFGMGMDLRDFRIERLHNVIPALDSIMPMMKDFSGVLNASIAVTSDISPDMYFQLPTLRAAMKFEGDSLVIMDSKTFKTVAKWLLFRDKKRNIIDHLDVELSIEDGILNVYPFLLNIDRYRLGIMGSNNLDFDLNYHIAVLKSPIPFKFGINIKGRPDKFKIRFGGAKFKDKMIVQRDSIANKTRLNLLNEMKSTFRRGLKAARIGPLQIRGRKDTTYMDAPEEIITHADSTFLIREGLIELPDTLKVAQPAASDKIVKKVGKNKKK